MDAESDVPVTHLPSVQSDGREGESGHVQRAVLHKATDVTHDPSKHPSAVHKSDLEEDTHTQHGKPCPSLKNNRFM